jgi:6-phosphogluconolactonase (cycloisomerase 2 family)
MRFVLAASIAASIAVLVSTSGGCGKGLFPEVTASGAITPTPVGNAYLYATNFNDGTVSAFVRNTNTGALGFIAKISAGAAGGPEGVVVSPQNDLAYVVNAADNNIYQYTVTDTGNLTFIGRIASDATPQMVAVDSNDTYVYVTNFTAKTVTEYFINNNSPPTLTFNGRLVNFLGQPFSIIANASAGFVYVADNAGLIYAYSIGGNGLLTQIGTAVNSNGGSRGNPGQMAIASDSSQSYLLVDDRSLGVVSIFTILTGGGLSYNATLGATQATGAVGIGAVNNGGGSSLNYVLTAYPTGNFVQPFVRSGAGLTLQTAFADSSGPTGLVIDPAGLFAYTGNSGSGTIALIGINNSQCGTRPFCVINSYASESPANSNAGTQFVATTH